MFLKSVWHKLFSYPCLECKLFSSIFGMLLIIQNKNWIRITGSKDEHIQYSKSSHRRGSLKKVFLKISQISQETLLLEPLFNKVTGREPATLLKSDSNTGACLWNFRNFQERLFWRISANGFISFIKNSTCLKTSNSTKLSTELFIADICSLCLFLWLRQKQKLLVNVLNIWLIMLS